MIKQIAIVLGMVSVVGIGSTSGWGQSVTTLGKNHSLGSPTVSPYLNLLTVDNFGIAGGYQTLVKPFVEGRKAINSNAAGINRLQSQIAGGGGRGGGGGGAGFGGGGADKYHMNYSHYYQMR